MYDFVIVFVCYIQLFAKRGYKFSSVEFISCAWRSCQSEELNSHAVFCRNGLVVVYKESARVDSNSLDGQTKPSAAHKPEIRALANGRNRPVPFA